MYCVNGWTFIITVCVKKVSETSFQTTFLLSSYPYLTATAAFTAATAAVAFFRFEHEFSQEEEYAGEHNQADDNILSHDDSILEESW